MTAVGKGVADGYLSPDELDAIARDGLGALPVDGRRVLVIIPDGTRTMPMPLMFELHRARARAARRGARLSRRARHAHAHDRCPVDRARRADGDGRPRRRAAHLQSPVGRPRHVRAPRDDPCARHCRSHRWAPATRTCRSRSIAWRPSTTTSSSAVRCFRTRSQASPAARIPVSGHRRPRDHSLHALARRAHHVVRGDWHDRHGRARGDRSRRGAARHAAVAAGRSSSPITASPACSAASARGMAAGGHAVVPAAISSGWTSLYDRVLAIMPPMYDDLWTAGKGMYKSEPVVADGGEVIIYAPHVTEVSRTHGTDDRGSRLPLPRLLSRAVGTLQEVSRAVSSRTPRT